jgi:hypothetical protein
VTGQRVGGLGWPDEADGGGVGAFNAALEIENEDARRRGLDEAFEQHAFSCWLTRAFAAQGVNHPVVHADELVHLALAPRARISC